MHDAIRRDVSSGSMLFSIGSPAGETGRILLNGFRARASSVTQPQTATTGVSCALDRTPAGTFPLKVCTSIRPSPVTIRSAPSMTFSKSWTSSTISIPLRISPPRNATNAAPRPPAAPAPGNCMLIPSLSCTFAANRLIPSSSICASHRLAPFCGENINAAPSGPYNGDVTSLAMTKRDSRTYEGTSSALQVLIPLRVLPQHRRI